MNKIFLSFKTLTKFFVIIMGFLTIPLLLLFVINDNYINDNYINISIDMDKDRCQTVYSQEECTKDLEAGYYFFSQADIDSVKKIDGVEDVQVSYYNKHTKNSDNSELVNNEIVTLDLTSQDVITKNDTAFLRSVYNTIDFSYEFKSLQLPFDTLSKTGMIVDGYQATNLIGDLKDNNTEFESVIIPETLALYYDVHSGQTISLPVKVLTQSGYEEREQEYFVAGIYSEEFLSSEQKKYVYVDYTDLSAYESSEVSVYNKLSAIYGDDKQHASYFVNEDDFIADYYPFYDEIHVFLSEDADLNSVVGQIGDIFDVQTVTTAESNRLNFMNNISKFILGFALIYLIIFLGNILNARGLYKKYHYKIKEVRIFNVVELSIVLILIQVFEVFVVFKGYDYRYMINVKMLAITIILTLILFIPYIVLKILDKRRMRREEK